MPAIPAWPPKSAPRLFVAGPLSGGQRVALEGPQAHYLARVMRVEAGDTVIVCDDLTGEWAAEVGPTGKRDVILTVAERLRPREEVPDFILCAALLKKSNFDWLLEKATELGVRRIQPLLTRRSVADKLNPGRARAIMTEAAEQCARTALPVLAEIMTLDALLRGWENDRPLMFADEAGGAPAADAFAFRCAPAALLIGPEGGFDDAERAAIRAHTAATPISLGPRILRAETAAIAGCAVWMAIAGDGRGTN